MALNGVSSLALPFTATFHTTGDSYDVTAVSLAKGQLVWNNGAIWTDGPADGSLCGQWSGSGGVKRIDNHKIYWVSGAAKDHYPAVIHKAPTAATTPAPTPAPTAVPKAVATKARGPIEKEQWFCQWVYGVLQMIKDVSRKNPTAITLAGIKPGAENFITNLEWPTLVERVREAFKKEKMNVDFSIVTEINCDMVRLEKEVAMLSLTDFIIVASSPGTRMAEVEAQFGRHPNVRICWATEADYADIAAGKK